MKARLYTLSASHPAQAGRLMVERKGIDAQIVDMDLMAGLHDLRLRAAGFKAGTVPALKLDGRKVQGTREIARALEEAVPQPSLFGADAAERQAIEAAEGWGHDVLQPIPRGIIRAALVRNPDARAWFVGFMGFPAFVAPATVPIARRVARASRATPEWAIAALAALPGHVAHVESLLADGVLGGEQANAADFQIAPTLRFLLAMEDIRPIFDDGPAARFARAMLPDYAGPIPTGSIPAEWLTEAGVGTARASAREA